jgi:ABC-type nitrate/sulfonate/bicarbonate transport system ATPase subunit
MLLDEPFSALDTDLRARLVEEVSAMLRERGCATVYVTHDPGEAAAMADTVVRLEALNPPHGTAAMPRRSP